MRANEKFSGRGHARHLCKDCARLGKEELAYRQAIRNLERLLTWDGRIPRKKREQFRKYLTHKDERVRAYAQQIEAAGSVARAVQRAYRDQDDLQGKLVAGEDVFPLEQDFSPHHGHEDDDIPF